MFQESFVGISKKCQKHFKEVSRVFQGSYKIFQEVSGFQFKGVSRKLKGRLEGVSRVFQGYFIEVEKVFQGSLKRVSRKFHGGYNNQITQNKWCC